MNLLFRSNEFNNTVPALQALIKSRKGKIAGKEEVSVLLFGSLDC